ncbi:MAG: hypothetical protein LBP87_03665 [Planctomycetaceae bacterium]|nr:hypothetical protein [Planctomycetaceae bacterium]
MINRNLTIIIVLLHLTNTKIKTTFEVNLEKKIPLNYNARSNEKRKHNIINTNYRNGTNKTGFTQTVCYYGIQ